MNMQFPYQSRKNVAMGETGSPDQPAIFWRL